MNHPHFWGSDYVKKRKEGKRHGALRMERRDVSKSSMYPPYIVGSSSQGPPGTTESTEIPCDEIMISDQYLPANI